MPCKYRTFTGRLAVDNCPAAAEVHDRTVFPTFNRRMAGESGFNPSPVRKVDMAMVMGGPSQIQEIPPVPIRTPRSNFITKQALPRISSPSDHHFLASVYLQDKLQAVLRIHTITSHCRYLLRPAVSQAPPSTPTTSANSPHLQFRSARSSTCDPQLLLCPVPAIISQFQSRDANALSPSCDHDPQPYNLAFEPVPNISPAML